MVLNDADRALEAIEEQAVAHPRRSEEIERVVSISSVSTSSSSSLDASSYHRASGAVAGSGGLGLGSELDRIDTQRDLDRHQTELSRIQTARSQHSGTVGRDVKSKDWKRPLPGFGAGKPYPPLLPNQDDYVVEFDGPDDPLHAQNWAFKKKLLTAIMLGFTTMTASFGSSIFSSATVAVGVEFGVSSEVSLLGVSLYVIGFATGPTLWAPLSELKGRRLPLVLSMFGFTIFNIANAVAKDLQTVLITRFFAGFFGACPLAVVAAVFSDMFDNRTRGIAITVFSMTVFTGPLLAPFIGGFIVTAPTLGWRWTSWIVTFMGALAFILDLFFLRETYPPTILVGKAAELRRRTLNWGIHAKQEEIEIDLRELVTKNFSRPMRLLFTEPIVFLLSLYMAFIYGLLYLFLTAYPFVFQGVYHMTPGVAGLTFLGMVTGQVIAGIVVLLQQPWYQRKLAANNGVPVPEWRLPSVIAGGVAFAGGLFWFGWSGYTGQVHWIVPTLSGLLTGFGLASIFLQALNYLVDAYLMFAASAIAANTFLRSLAGAGFPLFSRYMFQGLGIQWASTLLGCVAAVLVPIPIVFWMYGHRIRARSSYAPTAPAPAPPGTASSSEGDDEENEKSVRESLANAGVPRVDRDARSAV
ncbi:major facilitator superfamily domain-containing protein [Dichotomopilus funicola]|uniref:Major facilitator superfamily domain-containing protein n=1 Tax=Dichotomopilus funicola TaxID=1934379 RepID=A0AAN6V371_9PEZI|nr:major facilitator superfamily domain-containing protein [Dichotomopilus funicola]